MKHGSRRSVWSQIVEEYLIVWLHFQYALVSGVENGETVEQPAVEPLKRGRCEGSD